MIPINYSSIFIHIFLYTVHIHWNTYFLSVHSLDFDKYMNHYNPPPYENAEYYYHAWNFPYSLSSQKLPSLCVNFACSRISNKWMHAMCAFLYLACSAQHGASEILCVCVHVSGIHSLPLLSYILLNKYLCCLIHHLKGSFRIEHWVLKNIY